MKKLLLFFTLLTNLTFAQQDSLFLAKIEHIQSKVLNEERILNIYIPEGYHPDSAKTYPVIYVLDGSANEDFIHLTGIVQFLVMSQQITPSIVVGIANVDRKRDFTYPTTIEKDKQDYPTTGHSEEFIRFLETECIPFVQTYYKTNDQRTIIGQSLGGLLASEILLKKTALFNKYLIVSPSFWWNNQSLLSQFKEKSNRYKELGTKVFITVGKEHPIMMKDAKSFAKYLSYQIDESKLSFMEFKKEDHATILHTAAFEGLKWLGKEK
ncbi:alpha/beta hydrolase-fold protein [Fluviicola sp.]|jgi:predicted alpha/beta superfamily hydrolase|uniref:alpha/beta hydrolase n=1 Tax=Fluviicola sp. TaxID=1917219 RepID=UPI0028170A4A|nr:alpha/beta hydrolase-fold protein [Fluviicola sp.]MDR0802892.1 alpha/beta hydrolase [Fluviicola sp.]